MADFKIYSSNRTELLAEKLAAELRKSEGHPLRTETVLVQSRGMEKWLSLRIAEINGISANINFPFPRHFTKNLFRAVTGLPEIYPFAPEIMTWNIMGLIPELIGMRDFEAASDYISGDDCELKTFQLASRIAAIFDQYLVYRPEMLLEWDAGRNPLEKFKESRWQFELWKKLSEIAGPGATHLAAMRLDFMGKIRDFDGDKLPETVHVFGITGMPLFYMEMLQTLSSRVDVIFYYMAPSRHFWSDTRSLKEISKMTTSPEEAELLCYETGNKLLASLGRSGREFFSVLFSLDGTLQDDFFETAGKDSLLNGVQSDILELSDRGNDGTEKGVLKDSDSSIVVNSCHSRLREIEVLYDCLLEILSCENSIDPGDIAVMAPDISLYAPSVDAVFGTPESERLRIPFSIADRAPVSGSSGSIADIFLEILSLASTRVTVSKIMNIFESPHVYSKFGLDGSELPLIRSWAAESGMRWGLDGSDKTESGLPAYNENTIAFGTDRMILGAAMSKDADYQTFEGIMPMDVSEGNDTVTLGVFLRFCRKIRELVTELRKKHSLSGWLSIVNMSIENLFSAGRDSENELQELRKSISESGLPKAAAFSSFKKGVSVRVITSFLKNALNVPSGRAGFLSNGVTFCTMQPMRCIPFKVICLIGMNEGEYPVNPSRPGFDLREKARKLCDPSKRHEDRYVFLESILSARERLLISYVGQDIKENTPLPPSVLVSELLDYIDGAFRIDGKEKVSEAITVKHPLQPFSTRYFDGSDRRLFSFSTQNLKGALAVLDLERKPFRFCTGELPKMRTPPEVVSNSSLIKFFRGPAKYFVTERLKVKLLDFENEELEDDENMEFDHLKSYNILQKLTGLVIKSCPFEKAFDIFHSEGLLPHGASGKTVFKAFYEQASEFAGGEVLKSVLESGRIEKPHGEIMTEPVKFSYFLPEVYHKGQLFYRCSGVKAKDRARAWINHLSLCGADGYSGSRETYLIGKDKTLSYKAVSPEKARSILEKLIGIFLQGHKKALPFFPETSFAFFSKIYEGVDYSKASDTAVKQWMPSYLNSYPESTDAYNDLCFKGELPLDSEFAAIAEAFFNPLLEAEAETKGTQNK